MSQEEKKPEEAVAVLKASAPEQGDTIDKLHKLQVRFYEICGELGEHIEDVGEPMYNLMLQHYFDQYKREYELMNASEFIEADKQIEELKAERDRELEEVKLLRDTQKKQLEMVREEAIKSLDLQKARLSEELAMQREKELEEVKLEHEQLTAEIARKREKINNDIEILYETAVLEGQIKISRITPQSWRRCHIGKWHFGKVIKNEAMQYAEIAANKEIEEYLARRAEQLTDILGEDVQEAEPLSEREYKRWEKRFEKEQRKRRQSESESLDAGDIEASVQGGEPDAAANTTLIAENVESD